MTRRLMFEGPRAQRRFELIWTGFFAGGNFNATPERPKPQNDKNTRRQIKRIHDALEAISTGTPESLTNQTCQRTIVPNFAVLELQQGDFALLEQYIDRCAWTVQVERDVVDLQDWMDAADKVED